MVAASKPKRKVPRHVGAELARGLGVTARHLVEAVRAPYRAAQGLWRRRESPLPARESELHFEGARLAAEQGLHALASALSDQDPEARIGALEVVCEFSEERAARLLCGVLHDPDARVRSAAVSAAARLCAEGALFSLIFCLDDEDAGVRELAADAIAHISGRLVPLEQTQEPEARQALMEELKAWWKEERFAQLADAAELDKD